MADARGTPRRELVALLAPALGNETADELVTSTARRLALPLDDLSREQVLLILEELAAVDGLVGVVARFAKARAILRGGQAK